MTVIDKIVSPRSVIDDWKPAHFFTNSLSARIYKFIACKLHNSLFVSVPKRKLHECYHIHCKILCAAWRFIVCAHEFSLAERDFEEKSLFVEVNYRSIRHEISCELASKLLLKNHGNKERNSRILLALLLHNTVCDV